jgi:2'-5' RNA ligase
VLAVEIYLDPASEECVRSIWAELDARGIESLGAVPGTHYRPHVSLAVFEDGDLAQLRDALVPILRPAIGMPLTLASLGFFLTTETIAFLAVTPTDWLLEVHGRVHVALGGVASDSWAYYEPGTFLPHCTIALRSDDTRPVVESLDEGKLPIPAVAHESHLVEISTGRTLARLA